MAYIEARWTSLISYGARPSTLLWKQKSFIFSAVPAVPDGIDSTAGRRNVVAAHVRATDGSRSATGRAHLLQPARPAQYRRQQRTVAPLADLHPAYARFHPRLRDGRPDVFFLVFSSVSVCRHRLSPHICM